MAQSWVNDAIISHRNGDNTGAVKTLKKVWTEDASKQYYNNINIYDYKVFNADLSGFAFIDFL